MQAEISTQSMGVTAVASVWGEECGWAVAVGGMMNASAVPRMTIGADDVSPDRSLFSSSESSPRVESPLWQATRNL